MRRARLTLPPFGRVQRNDMIALAQAGDAGPYVDDYPGAFVAQYRRKQALRIRARSRKLIGVTDPAGLDFHQDFARSGPVQIHGDDLEGFAGGDGNGGFCLHYRISFGLLDNGGVESVGRYPIKTRAKRETAPEY